MSDTEKSKKTLLSRVARKAREYSSASGDASAHYSKLCELAASLPEIEGCTLFLPQASAGLDAGLSFVCAAGAKRIPDPQTTAPKVFGTPEEEMTGDARRYYVISASDSRTGCLGVACGDLSLDASQALERLIAEISAVYERTSLQGKVRLLSDRLEVLSECSQVIASGVPMDRMTKTLVRQAAFRFSADVALVLLLTESGDDLEIKGSFGVVAEKLPERIFLENTLVERALRLGGIMTVPDLAVQTQHGLDFLVTNGISCIHTCSMETKTQTLGLLLVGYRDQKMMSEHDSSMLEEFAQGAGAALASASSQARLAAYAEQLEELVQRRTADLEHQTSKAEDANKAKSKFVANMSHELRTPLTAVIGYASVLSDGMFGPINDKQKDALTSIAKSSQHLKELIDEVLNLSRIEAGKDDPEPSNVEIFPLMQQIYKLMLQTSTAKNVQLLPITIDEKIKFLKLWVDPRHIRQILLNLMSNAVKYTPDGGTVQINAEIIGDKVKFTVQDTGVGIPPELQDRLFGRFERGEDTYSREQVGTGIGLSLTKHLCEINGGIIGVESEVGRGSNFWIMIPLAETSAVVERVAGEDKNNLNNLRLDGLNILVVDDNKSTCDVLASIISHTGGTAFTADTVAEAKRITDKTSLDAALVDLAIPRESGLVLIEYFRKHCGEPLSTMPIIVISACVFTGDREQAMEAGASHFIAKPFDPVEVIKSIRHLTTAFVLRSGSRLKAWNQEGLS
jgi:signal transduction histidine kinase/ActR/RegA family two-component response regulator